MARQETPAATRCCFRLRRFQSRRLSWAPLRARRMPPVRERRRSRNCLPVTWGRARQSSSPPWRGCFPRSAGAGAAPVAAGPLAAEEALREAGIAAGEDAHEVDVEGADGAVLLGDLGEGAGELVDVILAVCLANVDEAALLLHDAGRLAHPPPGGPALHPPAV